VRLTIKCDISLCVRRWGFGEDPSDAVSAADVTGRSAVVVDSGSVVEIGGGAMEIGADARGCDDGGA
jgi:hypothetical protein